MKFENHMTLEFPSKSTNEAFARSAVACFAAQLDPNLEELGDIRTAVSEAVTNAIVHAYPEERGAVLLSGRVSERTVYITVTDYGIGISDIDRAREPLYTGAPEQERSGLGFSIMESFCDEISVTSNVGEGTTVMLVKSFREGI